MKMSLVQFSLKLPKPETHPIRHYIITSTSLRNISLQKFSFKKNLTKFTAGRKGVFTAEGQKNIAFPNERSVQFGKALKDHKAKFRAPIVYKNVSNIILSCSIDSDKHLNVSMSG